MLWGVTSDGEDGDRLHRTFGPTRPARQKGKFLSRIEASSKWGRYKLPAHADHFLSTARNDADRVVRRSNNFLRYGTDGASDAHTPGAPSRARVGLGISAYVRSILMSHNG